MRRRGDRAAWLCIALWGCVAGQSHAPYRGEDPSSGARRDAAAATHPDAAAPNLDSGWPPAVRTELPDAAVGPQQKVPAYDMRAWWASPIPRSSASRSTPTRQPLRTRRQQRALSPRVRAARKIASLEELIDPAAPADSRFTDLTACGRGRFLLTARNDGFLFDLRTFTFRRHFCYVPEIVQEKCPTPDRSPARSAATTRASTRSRRPSTARASDRSQVGVWDLETGCDSSGSISTTSTTSPAVSCPGRRQLLLVRDGTTSGSTRGSRAGELEQLGTLTRFGVEGADGLAYDGANEELLVLDGRIDRLFVVAAELLAQP